MKSAHPHTRSEYKKRSDKHSKSGLPRGSRDLSVRVKTAKGRKLSETLWLQRQLNDPYVIAAREAGYRSRAAFKLLEIHKRFAIFQPGSRVVDLGAAPGGWSQVAAALCINNSKTEKASSAYAQIKNIKIQGTRQRKSQGNSRQGAGIVIALDIRPIEPIPDVILLQADLHDIETETLLYQKLGGYADVVLSDMAASSTGHHATDHLRVMALCELAVNFAVQCLAPGGKFIAKTLKGGCEAALLHRLKQDFSTVRHVKPSASRADSSEEYVVAIGFRHRAIKSKTMLSEAEK